jgi:tetratricopeptide (TPR) repeat protein
MRNGSTPGSTTAEVQPQTTITTSSVPSGPTPEDRFLDHYNKAVALIAANDKPGALAENKEALAVLPDDPRGLEQQQTIGAMPEPGQTAGAPPGGAQPPPGTTQKPPAPPVPEFLVVQAKPGESEKDRLTRERGAKGQLDEGRKALAEQRWDSAISSFQSALKTSERNDYGTVANEANQLLRQAQKGKATVDAAQRRANAQRVMDEAHTIGASNILLAVQKVREALALDPQAENATELLNTLIEHGRVQGETAVRLGRNHEVAGKKDDAVREYEKAERLLELGPPDNKSLEFARQRLSQLKPSK